MPGFRQPFLCQRRQRLACADGGAEPAREQGVNAGGGGGVGEAEGGLTSKPRSQSYPVRRRWAGKEGGGRVLTFQLSARETGREGDGRDAGGRLAAAQHSHPGTLLLSASVHVR